MRPDPPVRSPALILIPNNTIFPKFLLTQCAKWAVNIVNIVNILSGLLTVLAYGVLYPFEECGFVDEDFLPGLFDYFIKPYIFAVV